MSPDFNEPDALRTRLLSAEPADDRRLDQLQQEIDSMFVKKLNHAGRFAWFTSFTISSLFAGFGIYALWHPKPNDPNHKLMWAILTLILLLNAGFALIALIRGRFNLQAMMNLQKVLPVLTLLVAIVPTIQAMTDPAPPALARAIFGVIWLVIALAVTIYNRVVAAEYSTREALLRLELRLSEAAEKA